MKQEMRHRLAWLALAFAVLAVILMSGCSMFEEQIASMQSLIPFAGDKEIIECTSNMETGCEGWVASETTATE